MREKNKRYQRYQTIRKIVLAIVTPVLMGLMFVGHTQKAYSEEHYNINGQDVVVYTPAEEDLFFQQVIMRDVMNETGGNYAWETGSGTITSNSTPSQAAAPAQSTTPATPAPAQPVPTQAPKPTPTKTPEASKGKVTATFKNMYGVIIGTSKITKGTDISKNQFPKNVPDIVTSKGTYVFDHWNYDGKPLTDNISVKAIYKKAN